MKTFHYVFLAGLVITLIGSVTAMYFVGGYTVKNIPLFIAIFGALSVSNGLRDTFFMRKEEIDERITVIEERAKARAFDIIGIVFGILIVTIVLLKADLQIILITFAAYVLITVVHFIYLEIGHKEI